MLFILEKREYEAYVLPSKHQVFQVAACRRRRTNYLQSYR